MFDNWMDQWRFETKPGGFEPLGPVDFLVVHWIGGGDAPTTRSEIIAKIRSVYNGHMNHPTERYFDIAYNAAVDQNGQTWELRGMQYQGGATFGANTYTKSILYIGGETTEISDTALRRIALFRNQAITNNQLKPNSVIRGHRVYVSTDCPGDYCYAHLPYLNLLANIIPTKRRNYNKMDAWSKIGPAVFGRFAGKWMPISQPEWEAAIADGVREIAHTAAEMQTMRETWGRS